MHANLQVVQLHNQPHVARNYEYRHYDCKMYSVACSKLVMECESKSECRIPIFGKSKIRRIHHSMQSTISHIQVNKYRPNSYLFMSV